MHTHFLACPLLLMFTQRPVVLKVCFPFVPFNLSSFSLRHQLPALGQSSPKPPHFISTLHLRRWRNMMYNICKRTSGLHEEWRRLQVRKCHNICIKMKLIAGLTSALLLSLLPAYRRASARSHLTILADFLPSLSLPAASVVSRLSYETQSAIWQQATCTACNIKTRTLLPSTLQIFNQSDTPALI